MLQTEIEQANFSASEQKCLRDLLIKVGRADGELNAIEERFVELIAPEVDEEPAPLQSLWNHSDIVLTACVSLAVLNGRYPIDKAREVSRIAYQLGFSSRKLRSLEEQVLRIIQRRGEELPQDFQPSLPKNKQKRIPKAIQDAPYSEALFQLWHSDAELIQHTEPSITFEDTFDDT